MSDDRWDEIVSTLRKELSGCDGRMIRMLTQRIREGIEWLDTHMARYCELTCAACDDPCCDGRKVFYNRSDMLYLIASGKEIPPGQTRARAGDPCRYLDACGCRLPRLYRPYVCVWFLCEPQMEILFREAPFFQRRFIAVLEEVRTHRLYLESVYEHFAFTSCSQP